MAVYDRITKDGVTKLLADGANLSGSAETSATAAYAHPRGSRFTMAGELYVATSDIPSGGTITPGTNCARTYVGEELDEIDEKISVIDCSTIFRAGYYNTSGASIGVFVEDSGRLSCLIPVHAGDVITLTGSGGNASMRLWATADGAGIIKRKANANTNLKDGTVTIEDGEAQFLFNASATSTSYPAALVIPADNSRMLQEIGESKYNVGLVMNAMTAQLEITSADFEIGKGIDANGDTFTGTNVSRTDYLPAAKRYVYTGSKKDGDQKTLSCWLHEYDAQKTWLRRTNISSMDFYDVGDDCGYIRIQYSYPQDQSGTMSTSVIDANFAMAFFAHLCLVPTPPAEQGTYVLKAAVDANGKAVLSWVAET